MDKSVTVEQVFEVALAAERAVENLFRGLEAKFAPYEDLVSFWRHYAQEEAGHVRWLLSARARLSSEQLASLVSDEIMVAMRETASLSIDQALRGVKNLEDAYELVMEVENGETNAVFRFLLDNFEPDEQMGNFLRTQLNSHIVKLSTDLPARYQAGEGHRAIKAVDELTG